MFDSKIFYLTVFALVCSTLARSHLLGAPAELSGDELDKAVENLHATLAKLATGDGPSYTATKVLKASRQVVSGILEKFTVELSNETGTKQCDVQIWTQAWLQENGTNVKIQCEGDDTNVDSTW
ncbi:cystatin-like protein [Drosophila hydei]|uniref:Cystatin-like protein n=1 Tax=Drosophila hydei TaxID=7224 RepID=A0A6J2SU07_DROHY|nr:cystatin-like protein [Drosophila hydei]